MEKVVLESGAWSHGEIAIASTFGERLRGLKAVDVGSVLIETRSVHSFGMTAPFLAIGLSANLEVRDHKLVDPNRIVFFRGCRFVLELPESIEPPEIGVALGVRHA